MLPMQLSCTRCYPSGQSLHCEAYKYWTTLFLGTCGVCILSRLIKHLSIFPFLTQPSKYHMDSYLLFWQRRLELTFHLPHQNSYYLSSSASPCISYNSSWCALVSCKIASKTARSLWILFGFSTLWSPPLALNNQSWGLLCRSVFFISSFWSFYLTSSNSNVFLS